MIWICKLFFENKKFPRGRFTESQWKHNICDTVEFLIQPDILKTFMELDVDLFFQLISILFIDGKQSDLLLAGKELSHS